MKRYLWHNRTHGSDVLVGGRRDVPERYNIACLHRASDADRSRLRMERPFVRTHLMLSRCGIVAVALP
jgi:hypothetical protein